MKKIMKFIWLFLVILVLFFSIVSVCASFVPPKYFWGLYFLSYGLPIMLALNCLLIGLYFIIRSRLVLILLSFLISFAGFSNNWAFNSASEEKPSSAYSVLSYNVRLFDFYNWLAGNSWDDWKERTDNGAVLDSLYRVISAQKADFMCFQEYLNQNIGEYQTSKYFKEKGYTNSHIAYTLKNGDTQYGIATFSRYPIINKSEKFFGNYNLNNGVLVSDIKTTSDTIRIINVHLESFRLAKQDYKYLQTISDSSLSDVKTEPAKSLIKKIKHAFEQRSNQLEYLLQIIDSSPYPVILCGDFNELPNSYLYRTLSSKLSDSFLEKGSGLGSSFISAIPGIRIDYILHSSAISPFRYKIIEKRLSDHYPIKFDFKLLPLEEHRPQ